MAISLNTLANSSLGCRSRGETLKMLKEIMQRQLAVVHRVVEDTPEFNSAAHYTKEVTEVEHVCRLMWGAIPANHELADVHCELRQIIIDGTDPEHSSFWQYPQNYDQRVVEMSSIAVALIDANDLYWQPLNEKQKNNLITWLSSVSELELPPNNWRWFRILILKALSLLGVEIEHKILEDDLCFINGLYLCDGWYNDGPKGVVDYYNPFAFQLYALIYVRWEHSKGQICQKLLERAVKFSNTYQYWTAQDGKPLCYGRSLNYRFASAAFWAELARNEHPEINIQIARTNWQTTMCWWAQQPIWDQNAQLLPGFAYPNLLTSEFYTSFASPMLALKAFNALALAEEHPFWQASIISMRDTIDPIQIGQHLIMRRNGVYMLTNSPASNELRYCTDKYSKFAYSSDHGLCVESCQWIEQGWVGDNILAFHHTTTNQWLSRSKNLDAYTLDDSLISIWEPFSGCKVKTTQKFVDGKEVRLNQVTTEQPVDFILTGHAVDLWSKWFNHDETREAKVESSKLYSQLVLLDGPGKSCVYPCAPNTNLLYPHASVPAIIGQFPKGTTKLLVEVIAGNKKFNNDSHQGVTDEI